MFKSLQNLQQEHLHIGPFHLFRIFLNTLKFLSSLRAVGKLFHNKVLSDLKDICTYSRPANKLYCAKKYQNRHFVLQAGIYIQLMWKNVLYKY